jgi:hypothetical protein
MIVKCTHRDAAYSVDDEKVSGKKFGFEWPKCGTNVIIDNRKPEQSAPAHAMAATIAAGAMETEHDHFVDDEPAMAQFDSDSDSLPDNLPPIADEDAGDEGLTGLEMETFEESDVSGDDEELSLNVGDDFNLDLDNMEFEEDSDSVEAGEVTDETLLDDFSLDDEQDEDGAEPIALDTGSDNDFDVDALMQEGEEPEEEPFSVVGGEMNFSLPGDDDDEEEKPETEDSPAYDDYGYEDEIEPEIDLSVLGRDSGEKPVHDDDDLGGALREESFADSDDEFTLDLPEVGESTDVAGGLESTEDDITLDLDTLDLDLDTDENEETAEPEAAVPGAVPDDDITLDLDTLDIDLDDSSADTGLDGDDQAGVPVPPEDDITLDLDTLDLDLEEDNTLSSGIAHDELNKGSAAPDDDITLDIDSLDISLDDNDEILSGQTPDEYPDLAGIPGDSLYSADDEEEESRLSLEDAGLSLDELEEIEEPAFDEADDEADLKLSLEEIDPSLNVDDRGVDEDEFEESSSLVYDEDEIPIDMETGLDAGLPEVDIDRFEAGDDIDDSFELELEPETGFDFEDEVPEYLELEDEHEQNRTEACSDKEYWVIGEVSGKGYLNFSIDYSLRYSRVKALLRLLGLYVLAFVPHFVVFLVYAVLVFLLGVFNWVIILFSGRAQADYILVQENTLRNGLGILSSLMDVIEDLPPFAGRKDIDYSLQMNVVYPEQYSRILALLRLSVVGILVLALPQLLLFLNLTMGALVFSLIGMIAVMFNAKWPNVFFDFMVRYFRYTASVWAYITGVIDTYPSFRFE